MIDFPRSSKSSGVRPLALKHRSHDANLPMNSVEQMNPLSHWDQVLDLEVSDLLHKRMVWAESGGMPPLAAGDASRLKTLIELFEGDTIAQCTPAYIKWLFEERQRGQGLSANRMARTLDSAGIVIQSKQARYRARKRGEPVLTLARAAGVSPTTIYKEHRLFKATLLAMARLILPVHLFDQLTKLEFLANQKLGQNKSNPAQTLDPHSLKRLVQCMPTHELSVVLGLTLHNLWNVKQILQLRWCDVDLDRATAQVSIRTDHAKRAEQVQVPLHPESVKLLKAWKSVKQPLGPTLRIVPIQAKVVSDTFRRSADSVGLTYVNLNTVRAYARSQLLESGLSALQVDALAGVKA